MMLIKKVISAAAAVIAAGALAFSVFGKGIGTAGVYSADVYWDVQFWGGAADAEGNMNIASVTNAEITGDGIYTASIEFAYPLSYGQYFALGTSFKGKGNGENSSFADYPNAEITILSVKADGVEIKGSSVPDVNVENSMRVYIYNPWVDDALNYADDLDWTQGITEIEVRFEITGLDDKESETAIQTETPVEEKEPEFTTVKSEETVTQTEAPVEEKEPEFTTVKSEETATQTESPVEEKEPEFTTVKSEETAIQTEAPVEEKEPEVTTVKSEETATQTEAPVEEKEPEVTTVKPEETVIQTESEAEEDTEHDNAQVPSSDETTDSAETGNCGIASLLALMAVSSAAAVISKK